MLWLVQYVLNHMNDMMGCSGKYQWDPGNCSPNQCLGFFRPSSCAFKKKAVKLKSANREFLKLWQKKPKVFILDDAHRRSNLEYPRSLILKGLCSFTFKGLAIIRRYHRNDDLKKSLTVRTDTVRIVLSTPAGSNDTLKNLMN